MNRFQSELLHCSESFIYALKTLVLGCLKYGTCLVLCLSQHISTKSTTFYDPTLANTHLHENSPQNSESWSILDPEKRNRWNPTRPCEEMYSLYSTCCSLLNVEFLPVSIWAISSTGRGHRPRRIFFHRTSTLSTTGTVSFFGRKCEKTNRGAWGMWFCKFQHVEPGNVFRIMLPFL